MENENRSLQKSESKENLAKKVPSEIVVKSASEAIASWRGIVNLVLSIVAAIVGFFIGLPVYFYIPLGALVFLLIALGWYIFLFRPENKLLTAELEFYREKEREKNEIESLKEQIENLEIEHKKELDNKQQKHSEQINGRDVKYERTKKEFESQISDLKENLNENKWLDGYVEKQAKNIDHFLLFNGLCYYSNNFENSIPYIQLSLRVWNVSVFDLIFDKKIIGEIYFEGRELNCEKKFLETPDTILAGEKRNFIIEIELTKPQVSGIIEAVEKRKNDNNAERPELGCGNLYFFIEGEGFPQVDRKRLAFQHSLPVNLERVKYYEKP